MTAERGRESVHRERRAGKLSVVVAVQNVLVVACLLVTAWLYWRVEVKSEQVSVNNVHIQFSPISEISGNSTLTFFHTHSSYQMSLAEVNKQRININCSGPYILYVYVCYKSLSKMERTGVLQLEVEGSKTPVSKMTLKASSEVCSGLHSIAYLRAREKASLHLYAQEEFKIKNVSVGLSYLLGKDCYY